MNNIHYNFINNNLQQIIQIYQKEINIISDEEKGYLIPGSIFIKFDKENVQVYFRSWKKMLKDTRNEIIKIKERNIDKNKKNRHVITCKSQNYSYSISELYIIILIEENKNILHGNEITNKIKYSNKKTYYYEFETYLDKKEKKEEEKIFPGEWTIKETNSGKEFIELCENILKNNEKFKNFRNENSFKNIVIGGDKNRGLKYIDRINNYFINNKNNGMDEIELMDKIGNPEQNNFIINEKEINISIYSLRCINTLIELKMYFGENILENANICEIGSCHGGLCSVISILENNYKSYTLIDLPEVNEVAKKYIKDVNEKLSKKEEINKKIRYMNSESIIPKKYDILISEYSISELDKKGQEYYFKNIIENSKKIYLGMNIWDDNEKQIFIEKLERTFEIKEYPEYPRSDYPNYILVGEKRILIN